MTTLARIQGTNFELTSWVDLGSYIGGFIVTNRNPDIVVPRSWVEFYEEIRTEPSEGNAIEVDTLGFIWQKFTEDEWYSTDPLIADDEPFTWATLQTVRGPTVPLRTNSSTEDPRTR